SLSRQTLHSSALSSATAPSYNTRSHAPQSTHSPRRHRPLFLPTTRAALHRYTTIHTLPCIPDPLRSSTPARISLPPPAPALHRSHAHSSAAIRARSPLPSESPSIPT